MTLMGHLDMSSQMRALLIGLSGPALQALGLLWVVANVTIDTGRELTFRYVIFDAGHLVIAVGILVSIVCVPVAFQVAVAAPDDVELELFESELAQQPRDVPADAPGPTWEATE